MPVNTFKREEHYERDGYLYHKSIFGPQYRFQIVDEPPVGYLIWKIGKNMPDGYLPFCRLKAVQPFDGGRAIEPDTLKAIRCAGAQTILAAIGSGLETVEKMETYLEKHKNDPKPAWEYDRVKAALPIMRQVFRKGE